MVAGFFGIFVRPSRSAVMVSLVCLLLPQCMLLAIDSVFGVRTLDKSLCVYVCLCVSTHLDNISKQI